MGSGRGRPQCSYCGDMGHWDLATRRTIGLGKQRDGLYYLVALATEKSLTNHSSSTNQPACNLAISSTDLWHSRLGHVSPSRLSFIAKNFLNFSVQSNNACPICPLAKQSRLPFAFLCLHASTKWGYGFPLNFGECALTVHIINRLPSPILSFKTPFELLYSKPPSYSHLHVFGCSPMPPMFTPLTNLITVPCHPSSSYRLLRCHRLHPSRPFLRLRHPSFHRNTITQTSHSAPSLRPPYRPPIKLHDYVYSHVSAVTEPRSYSEAAAHPEWQKAMRSELQALQANGTWSLTPLSAGKTPIGYRWVCRLSGYFSPPPRSYRHACLHWPPVAASRQWFTKFSEAIQSTGYAQSRADYYLFTRKQGKSFIALLIYVDDIRFIGNDPVRCRGCWVLPIDTPMERGLKLSDKSDLLKDQGRYRRLVGRKAHMEAAFRVVRYLKNAPGQGLFFSSNNDFRLRAYCDSDWAGCPLTRRSTTGYCVFLGPSLISWRSKRQKIVSLSSPSSIALYIATNLLSMSVLDTLRWIVTILGTRSKMVPLLQDM
ncbi:hypothetical protein AAG906_019176 [Vitis piasezkii]